MRLKHLYNIQYTLLFPFVKFFLYKKLASYFKMCYTNELDVGVRRYLDSRDFGLFCTLCFHDPVLLKNMQIKK
jgi:hypothetical protein